MMNWRQDGNSTFLDVECTDDIYIDDIRFRWLPSVPADNLGAEGNLYLDF